MCCVSCRGSVRSRGWPGSWADWVTWTCFRCTGGRLPRCRTRCCSAGARRRVVLATSVAESSLTVPGVRVVVDSGLAREPRVDHARGLSALTTVRASQAAGRQRAGRAGREAPGVVYRCWTEAEDARLARFPAPEIKVADLTAFALQAACWGDPDASGLALLDAPPAGAMAAARAVLTAIGAVEADSGRATERGARLARTRPASAAGPRPAGRDPCGGCAPRGRGGRPAERGAAPRLRRRPGRRVAHRAPGRRRVRGALASGGAAAPACGRRADPGARGRSRGRRCPRTGSPDSSPRSPSRSGWRRGGDGEYLMVSGTRAELADGSRLRGAPWIAVAVADRPVGAGHARVRLAAVVDEERRAAGRGARCAPRGRRWLGGRGRGGAARGAAGRGGAAVRPLEGRRPRSRTGGAGGGAAAGGARAAAVVAGGRASCGSGWRSCTASWARPGPTCRTRRCTRAWTSGWSRSSAGRGGGADLARIDAGQALRRLLPWASGDAARLDELAPERIEVPSGSRIRVDYADPEQPVLAVKLQEMFGLQESPRVAGVPVLVHLLSPAGRPAAVTADLASFWRDGYRAVRAELRGRYPKHPWPEDPAGASPDAAHERAAQALTGSGSYVPGRPRARPDGGCGPRATGTARAGAGRGSGSPRAGTR